MPCVRGDELIWMTFSCHINFVFHDYESCKRDPESKQKSENSMIDSGLLYTLFQHIYMLMDYVRIAWDRAAAHDDIKWMMRSHRNQDQDRYCEGRRHQSLLRLQRYGHDLFGFVGWEEFCSDDVVSPRLFCISCGQRLCKIILSCPVEEIRKTWVLSTVDDFKDSLSSIKRQPKFRWNNMI